MANKNLLASRIKQHYSITDYHRSDAQINNEKRLIPFLPLEIPFSRWYLLPAAVGIQFCAGSLYAWSVYNQPIEMEIYGRTTNTAAITFYIAVGFFGLSAALFGPWLERNGPFKGCALGATGFFAGNLLAALAIYTKQMWLLFIGYGMVGGAGLGLSYISPVSALQKWFPDLRGLASGLAVCGFGAGSIAASPLQLVLIEKVGLARTFIILGSIYFVVMVFAAVMLRVPPPGFTVNGINSDREHVAEIQVEAEGKVTTTKDALKLNLIDALKSREYLLIYFMFFANAIAGLVFLSRLSPMVQSLFGKSKETGALIVSINGGFNLGGRFLFGVVSDYIGRKTCYLVTLSTQSIILACMGVILSTRTYWAFLLVVWVLSSCYGATFSLIPAMLADMFGSKNIGACHGIVLTAWSIAGVGGGLLYTAIFTSLVPAYYKASDDWPYEVNFLWLMAICILGFFVTWFIRTTDRDRLFPAAPNEVCRIRFFGRILRVNKSRSPGHSFIDYVDKEREQEEWEAYLRGAGLAER